jgi:hypothetical protein
MGVEWDIIGQNNSHALRNVGSFPQTLAAVVGGGVRTALGSEPAETKRRLAKILISQHQKAAAPRCLSPLRPTFSGYTLAPGTRLRGASKNFTEWSV